VPNPNEYDLSVMNILYSFIISKIKLKTQKIDKLETIKKH